MNTDVNKDTVITLSCIIIIHDWCFVREGLPPSTVMAIVALVHFAIMHILIGRHSEWVRKLDFIWQHKKTSCHQNAQDMTTLRLGVVENALPSHVIGHYSNAECVVVSILLMCVVCCVYPRGAHHSRV